RRSLSTDTCTTLRPAGWLRSRRRRRSGALRPSPALARPSFRWKGIAGFEASKAHRATLHANAPSKTLTSGGAEFYRTTDQVPQRSMMVVMRSRGVEPSSLIPSARAIISGLDPNLPITAVQTMEWVVSASIGQPRLLSAVSGLFGTLAGLLAIVGVYGVTSYNVRRQRREYGIRLALGADPGAVRLLIIRRGAVVAVTGIAMGAVFGLLLMRLLASMLNDVTPTD